ncbi:MAG: hypothetical protein CME67_07925 [Halobacteriovoraceae bacterium]|nr:hypothetical protein [Halobacteriovoraceae bacterium]|tara:strand:- start:4778 stop:5242 length:465 start_codon:yes stop_codon:yes gene_type:complete
MKHNENAPKPIEVNSIDLDKLKEKTADLPSLLEYAHSVGGFSVAPTNEGAIKGNARMAMEEQTQMQLDQIFEQMSLLAKQAREIKKRADVSVQIYEAKMSFKPIVGKNYYLYEKSDNTKSLSIVSPEEWGEKLPFKSFIAKVKLLADHTWKVIV